MANRNPRRPLLHVSDASYRIFMAHNFIGPLSSSFSTSSKLAAAQSELQACESHLAAKERELAQKRCSAVRDGLGVRIRALVDCGWVWNELGKEALRSLDELRNENAGN